LIISVLRKNSLQTRAGVEGCCAWRSRGASVNNRVHQLLLTIFISTALLSFEAFGRFILNMVFIPKNEGVIFLDAAD